MTFKDFHTVCGAPDIVLVTVVTRDFIDSVVKKTQFGAGGRVVVRELVSWRVYDLCVTLACPFSEDARDLVVMM